MGGLHQKMDETLAQKMSVIEVHNLTKAFKDQLAIENINFEIEKGSVYGFLGPNGAGKTTTIKIICNLLSPSYGKAKLLGYESNMFPSNLWEKVGYVSEEQKMYEWMKVGEIIRFTSSFYRNWDHRFSSQLLKRLDLPEKKKVKELSKGMRGKLALLLSLAFKPEVLILDDPVSGLDPLVRSEFLENIIELIKLEGKTVLFSSHILDELERIADHILIINEGKLLINENLAKLKDSVKKIKLSFEHEIPKIEMQGIIKTKKNGNEITITFKNFSQNLLTELKKFNPKEINVIELNLQEIFLEFVKK